MNLRERIVYEYNKGNSAIRQIILINTIVFLITLVINILGRLLEADPRGILNYFYLPSNLGVLLIRPWTLVTNIFMHGGFLHFLFNMIILFLFGRIIEGFIDNSKIWKIFLGGGLLGGILFVALYNIFPLFAEDVARSIPLLGASGGVTAVVVASGVLLPYYEVFLFGLFRIQLRWIALVMVFRDIFSLQTSTNMGGLFAHMGGALFGLLFILDLQGRINVPKPKFRRARKGKMKTVHYDETIMTRKMKRKASRPNQEEIDAILDKISHSGYDSLTKDEKETLIKASE